MTAPDFTIHGVNGIKTNGQGTTDRLLAKLHQLYGYQVNDINQPIRTAWRARFSAKKDAKAIIKVAQDGDVLVGHSYAGLKAAQAMRGINFRAVFLFRPAMSRFHSFPGWQDTEIYCIYSHGDLAVIAGSLLLFHPFGLAGAVGFTDPFVINVPSRGGHSHDFHPDHLASWAKFIHSKIT
jgi:hypothetical protein